VDPELDRVARHIVERYQDPFFFTVHHEPEEEVDPSPGSGYTATDYADMFRHVVERLRAQGVDNLVSVLNLMGYPTWTTKPWFTDLYPGDHVVDWIGWDPYACLDDERHCGDFARLVNLTFSPEWPGFYQWAVTEHRDKPLMLAEWGVVQRGDPRRPPDFFESVARQLPMYPAIKALVYFDSPGTRVDATPESREAFRELVADPYFRQGVP
jgi:beta-mannanase